MAKAGRERFTIVVQPMPDEPGGPNVYQRLRSMLKAMKRSYRIECVDIAPGLAGGLLDDATHDVMRHEPPPA